MAKLFTIKKGGAIDPLFNPIKVGGENFIAVGETGRNRQMRLARFPGSETMSSGCLELSGETLVSISPDSPDSRSEYAGVLIQDQSGYRGGWELFGHAKRPCSMPDWKPRSHAEKMDLIRKWDAANPFESCDPDNPGEYFNRRETFLFSVNGPGCAAWAQKNPRTKENGDSWHSAMFPLRCPFDPNNPETRYFAETSDSSCPDCKVHFLSVGQTKHVTVKDPMPRIILEGKCAQGDAGRMGGGPEYVILLPKDSGFLITRSGRLYGAESWLNCWWDGRALTCETRKFFDLRHAAKTETY